MSLAWWEVRNKIGAGSRNPRRVDMPTISQETKEKFDILTDLLNPGSNKIFVAMHGGNYDFYTTNIPTDVTAQDEKYWKPIKKVQIRVPNNVYVMHFSQLNACGYAADINSAMDLFDGPKTWLDPPKKSNETRRFTDTSIERWKEIRDQTGNVSMDPRKKAYIPSLSDFGRLYLPGDYIYNSRLSFQISQIGDPQKQYDWEFDIFDINRRRKPGPGPKKINLYNYYKENTDFEHSDLYFREFAVENGSFPDISTEDFLNYIKVNNNNSPVLVIIYNCAPYLSGETTDGTFYPNMTLENFKRVENIRTELHDNFGFKRQTDYIDYLDNIYYSRPLYRPTKTHHRTITGAAVQKMYQNRLFVDDDNVKYRLYNNALVREGTATFVGEAAMAVVGNSTAAPPAPAPASGLFEFGQNFGWSESSAQNQNEGGCNIS